MRSREGRGRGTPLRGRRRGRGWGGRVFAVGMARPLRCDPFVFLRRISFPSIGSLLRLKRALLPPCCIPFSCKRRLAEYRCAQRGAAHADGVDDAADVEGRARVRIMQMMRPINVTKMLQIPLLPGICSSPCTPILVCEEGGPRSRARPSEDGLILPSLTSPRPMRSAQPKPS